MFFSDASKNTPQSMRSKISKLPLSLFFSFLFVLVIAETLVRVLIPQKSNYKCITSKFGNSNSLKANCTIISEFYKSFSYKIKTNEKSLRSNHTVSYQNPTNSFRILILGDSVTFGLGVNNEDLFSQVLEKTLNQQIPSNNFEVINASSPGWGPIEYYLYMKNEGYKYSPNLVIISQSVDDTAAIQQNRVDFRNLKFKQTLSNVAQINFDEVLIHPQKASIYQLIKQGITDLPIYENFLNDFHILILIINRLNQLEATNKQTLIKKTALYKFFEKLKNKEISEVTWKVQNEQFQEPVSMGTQRLIQYHFITKELTKLILKNKSQVLFLNIPTYQGIFKIVKKRKTFNPIKNNKKHSIQLANGISYFHLKNVTPLLFPKDLHWTPSGHYLSAISVFNYLINENLIPNLTQKNKPLDLNEPLLRNKIKSANKNLTTNLSENPLWFFNKAMIYKNQNRYDLAIETLNSYLKQYDDSEGWLELGKLQIEKNEKLKAIESFHKSLEYSSDINPKTLFLIGKNYFELKQFDEALKFLKESSQYKNSILPEVYNYMAIISHRKKDIGAAESYWKLAIAENTGFFQYHRSLANLYFDAQYYEKSLIEYQKSIALNPKQPRALALMGLAHAKLNQFEQASIMFNQTLKFEPNNQIALSGLNFLNIFNKDLSK